MNAISLMGISANRSTWSNEGGGMPPRSLTSSSTCPVQGLYIPTTWRSPTDNFLFVTMAASPSIPHPMHASTGSPTDLVMARYYNPRSQILSHLSFRLPTDKMAVEIQRTRGYRSETSKLPSSSDIHSLTVKASSAGTKRNSSKLRASSQTFIPSDSTLARLGKVTSSSTAPAKISIVSRTNATEFPA